MIAQRSQPDRRVFRRAAWIAFVAVLIGAPTMPAQDKRDEDAPVVPPDNGAHVAVTSRGTVDLHVADLPLSTVLQMLSIESKRNIVASESVRAHEKKINANLYGVSMEEALDAILFACNARHRQVGNVIYVHTAADEQITSLDDKGIRDAKKPELITRVFRLSYVSARDANEAIKAIIGTDAVTTWSRSSSGAGASTGGDASPSRPGGGNAGNEFLVVKGDQETLRTVEQYLREVDAPPKQVLVEATILRAELRDDNALGIDFTVVGGVDLEEMGAVSNGITNLALGNLPNDRYEKFNNNVTTDFAKNVPAGGITVGIIKDKVGAFLRALEDVTDTTVIANPKVLALNHQEAQVLVGRRDGYLTTTITETQAVQSVQFLETGTQLNFTPTIRDDGFVQIRINPKDSTGFVNAQGLPSEQTTETTTNVLVRDGQTILIAGLFRELTTDARSQVPGLGSIPGLGQLFRSNKDSSAREEVIILLTIRIVKDQDAYAEASRKAFEDIERSRIGLRQGLMWHGRERLAQHHYRKAVAAAQAGDDRKALWHAELARYCDARHLPAIQLKERILGRRAWEEDGAAARTFIHEMIAREKGYPLPLFDRPQSEPQP